MFLRSLGRALRIFGARIGFARPTLSHHSCLSTKPPLFTLDLDLSEPEFKKPEPKTEKHHDLSDILADIEFENTDNDSSELDRIFADLAKGNDNDLSSNSEYSPVTLDQTDEDISERDSDNLDIISEEKKLFENIFDTYAGSKAPSSNKLEEEVLWNLQESFTKTSRPAVIREAHHDPLSARVVKKCLERAKTAVQPTLDLILSKTKQAEVVALLNLMLDRYEERDFDESSFYMHKLNNESTDEFLERTQGLFDQAQAACEADPSKPFLHEYTMPVIFNHILREVSTRFYNGQLAISLFNSVKKDLNLYAFMVNQDTYNELLKVYWIYMGKSSLCEIELLVVEMMNNGFRGNLSTFTILREVIGEYHAMRMGKSLYNPGGAPIWSLEDEKRASNLGQKLRDLGKYLRNSGRT